MGEGFGVYHLRECLECWGLEPSLLKMEQGATCSFSRGMDEPLDLCAEAVLQAGASV